MSPKFIFDQNQILTLDKARELKGKNIAFTHPVYSGNKADVTIMSVGDIVPVKWGDEKDVYMLADANGQGSPVMLHKNINTDTFTCSDVDRPVYYVEL